MGTPWKKRRRALACEQAEAAGIVQRIEEEAGPSQAIPWCTPMRTSVGAPQNG
jgi:hypothetical protein